MTEEQTITEPTEAPTLPGFELPDYHGKQPVGMRTGLTGAGTRISRAHSIGDRVVLVIEAKCKKAGHEDTDDGIVYTETLKVADMFELGRDQGARLLSVLRSLHRQAKDSAEGKAPLPGAGDVGYTDGSGVVLLPEELAELRGDPVRVLLAPEMTPVVVVYSDGERMLWPDEYDADTPRPLIGSEADDEHENPVSVVELLHHATGEPVDADPRADVPATEAEGNQEAEVTAPPVPLAAVPDLPPAPGDVDPATDDWEDPEPVDLVEPRPGDFVFVNVPVSDLRTRLAEEVDSLDVARRLLLAEQRRGLDKGPVAKPRPGAVKAIEETIARLSAQEGES